LRAVRANAEAGSVEEGGSTITQQYVKKVLLRDDSQTLSRKIEEASMAVQLERRYSKDRILELYLNAIYFGNGAYGIEAAARQYFAKSVDALTLAEGALLAGLIQRPGDNDPYDAPAEAVERRNVVLEQMRANRFASDAAIDAALLEPLTLGSRTTPGAERYAAAYFVEEVKQWILDDPRFGSSAQDRRDLLFGGGLRIQTTVDLGQQTAAESAVAAVLPDPAGPSASLVSIEPTTGYVRAMVGGRDFFGPGENDKLNLATQGPRQAGSAFKPMVLAEALTQGIDPQTTLPVPACIEIPLEHEIWAPCNYGGGGAGTVSITEGTVRSYNTLYAQLIMRVGPEEAMAAATSFGIRSPLRTNPAAVLGTNEVTALDMASAYATFANRGIHVPPVLVTRITRADGTVLFQHQHTQDKVLDAEVADTLTSILEQVISRGTGTKAQIGRPAAGKTGTNQEWRDAWFAGYTPELATAVWIGFPQQQISMEPPLTRIRVTGGSYPAEVWQRYMQAALADRPPAAFHPPPTTTTIATTTTTTGRVTTTSVPRARVVVPNVLGLKAAIATRDLQEAGFVVERISMPPGSGPSGRVVGQSPKGGDVAPKGSTVRIEVPG
ncbi:MAG: transglycosylase domain-containing protein, partial [Acidimicrobiales bacterium]